MCGASSLEGLCHRFLRVWTQWWPTPPEPESMPCLSSTSSSTIPFPVCLHCHCHCPRRNYWQEWVAKMKVSKSFVAEHKASFPSFSTLDSDVWHFRASLFHVHTSAPVLCRLSLLWAVWAAKTSVYRLNHGFLQSPRARSIPRPRPDLAFVLRLFFQSVSATHHCFTATLWNRHQSCIKVFQCGSALIKPKPERDYSRGHTPGQTWKYWPPVFQQEDFQRNSRLVSFGVMFHSDWPVLCLLTGHSCLNTLAFELVYIALA